LKLKGKELIERHWWMATTASALVAVITLPLLYATVMKLLLVGLIAGLTLTIGVLSSLVM